MSSMNDAQIIFTLFFAISWGILSNVLPRWKPFHYALCFKQGFFQPTCRVFWSWVFLNILPWTLFWLSLVALAHCPKMESWGYSATFGLIVHSIPPGFLIPFGAYHLWLATIHAFPNKFYAKTKADVPLPYQESEPTADCLGISVSGRGQRRGVAGNLISGLPYIVIGMLLAHCCMFD